MLFVQRIRALVIKEIQALLGDPQSLRALIAPVVLQVALFPLAATLEVKNNTLAIFNEDTGPDSIELTQRLARAKAFTKVLYLHSENEVRETIDNQKALVVVRFASDFSRRVANEQSATVQGLLDGRRSNSSQIAFGYIQEIVRDYSNERGIAYGKVAPSEVIVRSRFNPNLDYTYFILPCLVAIILTVTTLIVTALSLAREREQGTFDQLLVSPLTPEMILLGKAIPAVIVALTQATIIMLAAVFIYRIPFEGSLALLYGSACFYIFSLIGFGLLISSVCATQQQAFLGVFCFIMPAILLSGFVAPVENMPHWLQIGTLINPLRHFIVIAKGIFLKDLSLSFVAQSILPLILITAVTLSASIVMFRRRVA
jgi:ABC-2 type transport system permease protein